MSMYKHKFIDPIHAFIRYSDKEKLVLNSWPMRRLHYVKQNSLAYLIYPGATHCRFEHSLGVMELAGRVFDTIVAEENRHRDCRDYFPSQEDLLYWRKVLRLAALCHDIGHLPFSHAAEEEILPEKVSHETFTRDLIFSDEMRAIWEKIDKRICVEDIVKLAIGKKKSGLSFTPWEELLSELIVGDVFGVDRMDYLLRDSHYTGVAYGRFDHYRLIDTLRVLPSVKDGEKGSISLGVDEGGLRSAEDLLLSRYFMFKQVYFHDVCRVYSMHYTDFLKAWLKKNPKMSMNIQQLTDNEVLAEMIQAMNDPSHLGHDPACCILKMKHYKLLYQPNTSLKKDLDLLEGKSIYEEAVKEFGRDAVKHDRGDKTGLRPQFPVLTRTNGVESSSKLSFILSSLPPVEVEHVFIRQEEYPKAKKWLKGILESRES